MDAFRRDFDFLFHNKSSVIKLTKYEYIRKRMALVEKYYCLDYFDLKCMKFQKYFSQVMERFDRSFALNDINSYLETTAQVKEITQPLLKKKSELFDTLALHFHKLQRLHPSIYSLRFSFAFRKEMALHHEGDNPFTIKNICALLTSAMSKFLNNSRQRVLLQKTVGYFWVLMKEPNGVPYIHVNFYMDNDRFNANLASEIKHLWKYVTDNKGCVLIFDISRRYGNDEVYNDEVRTMFSRRLVIDKSNIKDHFFDDFNQTGNANVKYMAKANDVKLFEHYLLFVARESYPVYTLNAISQNEKRYKDSGPTRFGIAYDPIQAKKIRSYATSKIK